MDGGLLTGLKIMFTLYEDEWNCFKVGSFIPQAQRGDTLFSYKVKICKTNGCLPAFFYVGKYNANAEFDAEIFN